MRASDFVSSCCQDAIRFVKHEAGSSPVCAKCGQRCNAQLPAAEPEPELAPEIELPEDS